MLSVGERIGNPAWTVSALGVYKCWKGHVWLGGERGPSPLWFPMRGAYWTTCSSTQESITHTARHNC